MSDKDTHAPRPRSKKTTHLPWGLKRHIWSSAKMAFCRSCARVVHVGSHPSSHLGAKSA